MIGNGRIGDCDEGLADCDSRLRIHHGQSRPVRSRQHAFRHIKIIEFKASSLRE